MRLSVRCDWLVELSESLEVEFVGVSLSVNFCHDVLVVVITKSSAKLVIVHVGLVLALAPLSGDLVGVHELEFAIGAFPSDTCRVFRVGQELEKELPQLDLSAARACGLWAVCDGTIGVRAWDGLGLGNGHWARWHHAVLHVRQPCSGRRCRPRISVYNGIWK